MQRLAIVARSLKLAVMLSNRFVYKSATCELELCAIIPNKVYQFRVVQLSVGKGTPKSLLDESVNKKLLRIIQQTVS